MTAEREVVGLERCGAYKLEEVQASMKKTLDHIGGIGKFISKTDSVLLKPNLLSAKTPDETVTTHPVFVEAIIMLLKEHGIKKIGIGDSPAIDSTEKALKMSGLQDVCERHGVKMHSFKDSETVHREENRIVKKFNIAKEVSAYSKMINLPKMKTHSFTMYTGATKNIFGCISGTSKALFHVRHRHPLEFSEMLLDLYETVQPDLSIMDGIIGMEGDGPAGGEARRFGVIITGRDAIAVDRCAIGIMGLKRVPLLIAARKRYWEKRAEDIKILGENIKSVKAKNVKSPQGSLLSGASGLMGTIHRATARRPEVIPESCISCGKCDKVCPADAIHMEDKTKRLPVFDYKKCIRCYCCHEVCPVKAIALRRHILSMPSLLSRP